MCGCWRSPGASPETGAARSELSRGKAGVWRHPVSSGGCWQLGASESVDARDLVVAAAQLSEEVRQQGQQYFESFFDGFR